MDLTPYPTPFVSSSDGPLCILGVIIGHEYDYKLRIHEIKLLSPLKAMETILEVFIGKDFWESPSQQIIFQRRVDRESIVV